MLQLLLKWPIFERQRQKLFSGHKREKAQYPFSYSLCKHTFDQVHPTFCVQRIDISLSLVKNHRSRYYICCCCSVVQSCPTFCNHMDYSMPGSPVLHYLPEFAQIHVYRANDLLSNHLILCHPLFLLP